MSRVGTGHFANKPDTVHAVNATGDDRTFCGVAYDLGAEEDCGDWVDHPKPRRVNCEGCRTIVLHARRVRLAS